MRALSEDGRALAIYLLTCPHGTIAGVFRLPDGYVCDDIQWNAERVNGTLCELFDKGFATRCEDSKWVWVTKHLEWNPPENPNQIKAAAKMVLQVPDSCGWKVDFIRKYGKSLGIEIGKAEPLPNPSETLPEPVTVTVAVTVAEDKTITSPAKLPTCPVDLIVKAYHEILPELPGVRMMDDGRKKAIKDRWKWVLTTSKPDGTPRAENGEQATEWFKAYFERARDNDFLMGKTARSADHQNWKPDIDYLMTTKGLKQVIEKTGVSA